MVAGAVMAGVLLVGGIGLTLRLVSGRAARAADPSSEGLASTLSTTTSGNPTSPMTPRHAGVNLLATTATGERTTQAVVLDDSTLVTTVAVVTGAKGLAVMLDGRRSPATLLGTDPDSGVAIVRFAGGSLSPDSTGTALAVRSGSRIWLAGQEVPVHVVAIGRHTTSPGGHALHQVMRLDVDEGHASEGQPLLDEHGTVIGLCTWDSQGDLVGIPIDFATSAARSLRQGDHVRIPWLGINGRDATGDGDDPTGALITTVASGGPAAHAGVHVGDVVTRMGSVKVTSMTGLVLATRGHTPNETVSLTVVRDDKTLTLSVKVGQRDAD